MMQGKDRIEILGRLCFTDENLEFDFILITQNLNMASVGRKRKGFCLYSLDRQSWGAFNPWISRSDFVST